MTGRSLAVLLMTAVFSAFAGCAGMSGQPAWSLPPTVTTAWVNDYPMAYRDSGSGPPVLFIHGAFEDYRSWESQMPEFSRRHRVIAVSLRHHYPEPWNGREGAYSVEQHAKDVAELIKTLGLQKVHLVGQLARWHCGTQGGTYRSRLAAQPGPG